MPTKQSKQYVVTTNNGCTNLYKKKSKRMLLVSKNSCHIKRRYQLTPLNILVRKISVVLELRRTGAGNHLNTTDTGSSSGWPTCAASSSRPTGTDSLDSLTALDEVAVKICGLITKNEAFRQIITDAVSIALQK